MTDYIVAKEALGRALSTMEGHGMELTLANLSACYGRESGMDDDWNTRFDQFLGGLGHVGDDQMHEALCNLLWGLVDCDKVFRGVIGLNRAVESVVADLAKAENHADDFDQNLQQSQEALEQASSLDAARPAIAAFVGQALAMAQRQEDLAGRLRETSEDLMILRSRLEEAYRQSVSDELTGLGNKRFFDARLRELAEEAGHSGKPLSLVLMDIDDFSDFNDQRGRDIGDWALELVAGILQGVSRETDVVARTGGDSFGLILQRTPLQAAADLSERIRETLFSRDLVVRGKNHPQGRLTASLGVAEYRAGESSEQLLVAAERALARAGREGFNTVYVDGKA